MGEAVGKLIIAILDALTPRSIRVLMVFLLLANGYVVYLHQRKLDEQASLIQAYQVEMAGLRADLKAMLRSNEAGNNELSEIRKLMIQIVENSNARRR